MSQCNGPCNKLPSSDDRARRRLRGISQCHHRARSSTTTRRSDRKSHHWARPRVRGAGPKWAVLKTTQLGPRCASSLRNKNAGPFGAAALQVLVSALIDARSSARPTPTNAATQDAAPAVRVARRAYFLCARRAPPPEKAAARQPTTKKICALGKHAQRRRISRARRACARPVAAHGAFRFEHKRQREPVHSRSPVRVIDRQATGDTPQSRHGTLRR